MFRSLTGNPTRFTCKVRTASSSVHPRFRTSPCKLTSSYFESKTNGTVLAAQIRDPNVSIKNMTSITDISLFRSKSGHLPKFNNSKLVQLTTYAIGLFHRFSRTGRFNYFAHREPLYIDLHCTGGTYLERGLAPLDCRAMSCSTVRLSPFDHSKLVARSASGEYWYISVLSLSLDSFGKPK